MGALQTIRKRKMIAQKGRCFYCDLPMWDAAAATVGMDALRCTAEHLKPRSEGGKDTSDNIVAACQYCNTMRHRCKQPCSPKAHRQHVRKRMAAGKWLAVRFAAWSTQT